MKYSNKELEMMREFLKHEDQYALICLKGQLIHKRRNEGKTKEKIFKEFEELGNDLNKYREILKL